MLFNLLEVLRNEVGKEQKSPLVDEIVRVGIQRMEERELNDIENGKSPYITGSGQATIPTGTITFTKD